MRPPLPPFDEDSARTTDRTAGEVVPAGLDIAVQGADRLEDVRTLWVAMVDHHRSLVGDQWPVRTREEAWRRRRAQYLAWMGDGAASLLVARPSAGGEALGYAFVRFHEPGPTWDLGPTTAELESLAVRPGHRGQGTGRALIGAARRLVADRGIRYWSVSVVEANADAVRLYERAGFGAWHRQLLGPVQP